MSAPMPFRFRAYHMGCKVNQVDGAALEHDLRGLGFIEAGEGERADVCLVNACTVTSGADRDSRKLVSRARTSNDGTLVVLTGCLLTGRPVGAGSRRPRRG
ncbi:MAG: hypothetical protein M5R36_22335 [Deltaproteobacteria bacterium]|nr:hypothetical protein [Deltaproteobacteria bacterium]